MLQYSDRETEFSKTWVKNNPQLFSENILSFMEQHPQDYWDYALIQTKGYITVKATLKSNS